jgi:hypothetical protein
MTSIAAVIERARAGGQYSERKRFTIARGRAIEKMRRFALADPHFYILELIQAAVANGAAYIDIAIDDDDVTLAYVGGGLRRDDLGNLFDYLFASKDRAEVGHLRELALGINAALLFEPSAVIVESGDGTQRGTTRLEVHGADDTVDIGTPERPLTGTFVRIEGLQRGRLPSVFRRALFGEGRSRELSVIESRCLAAPVPIILNGDALFGFSAQRTPGMVGYRRALAFDEGDLYGTIALGVPEKPGSFDLLTWGVMVHSREHTLLPGVSISGIVCFDRLRKTADHSGIVDDERMAEMWARLLPYAQQLVHGEHARAATLLTQLDGSIVPAVEVRPLVQEASRIVLVPASTPEDAAARTAAREVARTLGAPVLCADPIYARSLRAMSGGALSVAVMEPSDPIDMAFYRQAEAEPPARPWLAPVVELDPLSTVDLLAQIIAAHTNRDRDADEVVSEARAKAHWLGTGNQVHARVFTPAQTQASDALTVEVVTTGRTLWSGSFPSAYPGHVLQVELPDARPRTVQKKQLVGGNESVCAAVARAMALLAASALRQAFARAVDGVADQSFEPGDPMAHLVLRAASRVCVPRLGVAADGTPTVELEQVDALHVDLRALPVLRTLEGSSRSLAEVALAMRRCHGLIYGVAEGQPHDLEGLDVRDILVLSADEERWLLGLFGASSYVQVDGRDVLAMSEGARVRDIAVGLRDYPDHPLLVEDGDPQVSEAGLVRGLIERFVGREPALAAEPRDAASVLAWQECRRHAGRVLQRYVCEVLRRGAETPVPEVFDLPLFLDPEQTAFSVHEVVEAMHRPGGLPLVYGHAFGGAELGVLARAAEGAPAKRGAPHTLAASSWLHHCLAGLGPVRVAFDFDLAHHDAPEQAQPHTWLHCRPVELPGVQGVVGIPREAVEHPDIALLLPGGGRARALASLAVEFGCVGWIRVDANVSWDRATMQEVERAARAACVASLSDMCRDLARGTDVVQRARYEALLLEFAARHLTLFAQPESRPRAATTSALADRVLTMPLFPAVRGEAMTGWRLVRAFCAACEQSPAQAREAALASVHPDAASHLTRWVVQHLDEASVVHKSAPAPQAPAVRPAATAWTEPHLQDTVQHWLRAGGLEHFEYVWVHDDTLPAVCDEQGSSLYLHRQHPRVSAALHDKTPQAMAWLLLAVFAHLMRRRPAMGRDAELAFQRLVSRALRDGILYR